MAPTWRALWCGSTETAATRARVSVDQAFFISRVAQSAEQRLDKPQVDGSIPSPTTNSCR